jgi:magnesium chelatase family protein
VDGGLTADGRRLLLHAADRGALSARGYHRTLRVARTIADLDGDLRMTAAHIAEALHFRIGTPTAVDARDVSPAPA